MHFLWPCARKTVRPSVSRRRNANFELPRCIFCGPAQAKRKFWPTATHFLWPCAGETHILTYRDAFFVALRRRNVNLTSRDTSCVHIRWMHEEAWPDERKSPRRYSETRKKFPGRSLAQAKRKFWPPESRFLWHCAGKTAEARKRHLDLRGFTLTVRTPQCDTLFGEWWKE